MIIQVLGSAAGGGFPQWNCNCDNCNGVRNGTIKAQSRTQSSIAVSADGDRWVILNTSPDIRVQIEDSKGLQPKNGKRDTGIVAVILVDSQIDHTTGLLMLREGCPIPVYATEMVQEDLSTGFPILSLLKSWNGGMDINTVSNDETPFTIDEVSGIEFIAVPVAGKAPPYSPHRHDSHVGDNIAVYMRDTKNNKSVFYAPGLESVTESVLAYMQKSDCVMVDGTFWQNDEMVKAGVGTKLAAEMGHLHQSGEAGMIEQLKQLSDETRKILIHINNTNPILVEDSKQRKELDNASIEVAFDGMSVTL